MDQDIKSSYTEQHKGGAEFHREKEMIFDYVILNGELIPIEQAQIFLFNSALFSNFGVYEAVKIDQGRPFFLKEHLHRLFNSAQLLDLKLGVEVATLEAWFKKLIKLDPEATWSLKILVVGALAADETPLIALKPTPLATYPAVYYQTGATAILYEGQRLLPACKSLNMLLNFLARRAATQANTLESLLYHDGHLTEGSRSNLFAVKGGRIITPPKAAVLSGITREIIFAVMQDTAYPIDEMALPAAPHSFDEFFITSTSMHVMPITQIDGRPVGDGRPGPVTKMAMQRFEAFYSQIMTDGEGA